MSAQEHAAPGDHGLPAPLPPGERVLWRGAPRWTWLAVGAYRVGWVAAYFALLGLWRGASLLATGAPAAEAVETALWFVPLAATAVAILGLLAWLTARATTYTITTRRVVLQLGVAVPITMNLPLARVAAAALRVYGGGTGDIPLTLLPEDRVPYLALWPHVRPWRWAHPQPTLRAVPDAAAVAGVLAAALAGKGTAAPVPGAAWDAGDSRADARA
jgi:hypothetical protein